MSKLYLTTFGLLAVAILAVGCGGDDGGPERAADEAEAPAPMESAAAGGSSTIAGVVNYTDGDPDTQIAMDADPVCVGLHPEPAHTQTIVADDSGRLANVFVYVKSGLSGSFSPAGEAHVLDQQGCMYHPHVSGIQVGQKLVIRNSDPTLHNVHALPAVNAEFNKGQPFQGMEFEHTFDQPEVMVRFKCDVHPWMSSYMAVVEHPYFTVSGEDGSFSIADLPAGSYTLEAWHETLGTKAQDVTVGDGESVDVSFDFAPAG